MIRRILILLYFLSLIPMAGSMLSQHISPATVWPLAFLGLLFPVLIVVQILFLVAFLLMKRKVVVLPLLIILASWPQVNHTFQLVPNRSAGMVETGGVRVMTYNVRLFDLYNWSGNENAASDIIDLIRKNDPDILCLQEMLIQEKGPFSLDGLKEQLGQMPYSHFDFYDVNPKRRHGLAIFSKYPILGTGGEHFSGSRNMMTYADLSIGTQKVRVFNNHLESTHFERNEFELIDMRGAIETKITREKVNVIVDRMKQAYRRRASQADLLNRKINDSPYPVIVCGDFNDAPVSYATFQVRRGLHDAFRSGGRGMGVTFPGMIIPLRIDYILHDKAFRSGSFQTGKVGFSDHRPVCCTIYTAG
ncbi:MAG: endonuclease/exonuclease/phosphatase family protein [Bacteroidales bacterium]